MIEEFKNKSLTRLKKARGQIDGIIKMIEKEKYCADVIIQLLAVLGAVKGTSLLLLESHLNTCGEKHLASNDLEKKAKFIDEIVKICELSSR